MPGTPKPRKKTGKSEKADPIKVRAAARSRRKRSTREVTEKIRTELIERRQTILDLIDNVSTSSRAAESSEPGDLADWAAASFEMDITTGILRSETQELQAIDEALARIEQGTYGICEDCEQRIPDTRLEAVPHATFCIQCKMQREREHSRSGAGGRWRPAAARLSPEAKADDDAEEEK